MFFLFVLEKITDGIHHDTSLTEGTTQIALFLLVRILFVSLSQLHVDPRIEANFGITYSTILHPSSQSD